MKIGLTVSISFVVVIIAVGMLFYDWRAGAAGIRIDNASLVARGEVLYAKECAACHGKNREGQIPDWRQRLPDGSIAAPPHDATGHTWHHPDGMLFEITKFGRLKAASTNAISNMPAFGDKLSDADIWAVLSFLKSKWPAEIQRRHDALNQRYRHSY